MSKISFWHGVSAYDHFLILFPSFSYFYFLMEKYKKFWLPHNSILPSNVWLGKRKLAYNPSAVEWIFWARPRSKSDTYEYFNHSQDRCCGNWKGNGRVSCPRWREILQCHLIIWLLRLSLNMENQLRCLWHSHQYRLLYIVRLRVLQLRSFSWEIPRML